MPFLRFVAPLGAALVVLATTAGCVKNQEVVLATRLTPAPAGVTLKPPPPERLFWLRAKTAKVPVRNRGGQLWDELGAFPDPYVRVSVGKKVLFESEVAENTLQPTWSGLGNNYALEPLSLIHI